MIDILVIGIDGASWSVIKPNINQLPNLKKIIAKGRSKTIFLKEILLSAPIWCSMFSGKTQKQHKHLKFSDKGVPKLREDIKVDFIWDILERNKKKAAALNIPFVYPPYNYNCYFEPIEFGLATDPEKMEVELNSLLKKTNEIIKNNLDLFAVVFPYLDKIQHFHWGEPVVLEWYKKIDKAVGALKGKCKKLIIISDHGFCDRGKARNKTLPERTKLGKIKGDHHEEAILITKNIKYEIMQPEDVFFAIKRELKV